MKTLIALLITFATLHANAFGPPEGHSSHAQMAHQMSDHPAVHGMVIFGKGEIFASHLPMTHSPHNYHAVFEIELPESVAQAYLKAKAQNPDLLFTIAPEPFVLPDLASGALNAFKAVLYSGHFEQGGTPVTQTILVKVKKVVFFEQI